MRHVLKESVFPQDGGGGIMYVSPLFTLESGDTLRITSWQA